MGFLSDLGKASISALTTDVQFAHLREENKRLTARLEQSEAEQKRFAAKAEAEIQELRDRVLKLETLQEAERREREADRSKMQAEVALFKTEVERFELRLSRLLPPPTDNLDKPSRE